MNQPKFIPTTKQDRLELLVCKAYRELLRLGACDNDEQLGHNCVMVDIERELPHLVYYRDRHNENCLSPDLPNTIAPDEKTEN